MTVTAPPTRRTTVVALLLVLAVAATTGCSSSTGAGANGSRVDVTVKDFDVVTSRKTVPAGTVDFHITNHGPSTHEINVDRTRYSTGYIPRQRDGLTADESAAGLRRIDSIEQLNLHDDQDLIVRLRPGRYVLWCNLEGHYLGGMHETIDVVADGHR